MYENLNQVKTRLAGIKGFYNDEIREESVLNAMREIARELKFVTSNPIEVYANSDSSDLMFALIPVGKMSQEKSLDNSQWANAEILPKLINKMGGVGFACSFMRVQNGELKVGFARLLDESDYADY
jgi:hypothetical protein